MTNNDPVLDAIENGDAHDNLLGHMREDETAEDALERLLFALPSFASLECRNCGADVEQLDDESWVAFRAKVAGSDHRRTDLYCDPGCFLSAAALPLDPSSPEEEGTDA